MTQINKKDQRLSASYLILKAGLLKKRDKDYSPDGWRIALR
jgi:hypothetical protein